MKKIFPILSCAAALFLLSGCEGEDGVIQESASTLKIVSADLVFLPGGGTKTVEVSAAGPVRAVSEKDWCAVSVSGSTVNLDVGVSASNESRYSRVTISSGDESLYVTVQQMGAVLGGLDIDDLTFPVEGGGQTFPVVTNLEITFAPDQDWIHAGLEDGVLTVTVDPNTEPGTRVGVLNYVAGTAPGAINILQYPETVRTEGWTIVMGEGTFEYPHQKNSVSVTASADLAAQKYVLAVVPASSVSGDVGDYAFSSVAAQAKARIEAAVAAGTLSTFGDGLYAGDVTESFEDLSGDVYAFVVGFGDNGYVSGLYQYARFSVENVLPAYYKWAGKWKVTGTTTPYTGVTFTGSEEWTISIDEDALEKTLTVRGMNSHTTASIVANDADAMKLTYHEDGTVSLLSQSGKTYTHSATYGDSYLSVQGLYTKNGTSYSRASAVGLTIFTAKMSDDGNSADITGGVRTTGGVDYPWVGYRLYLVAGTGSTYSLGASSGVIPLPFEMTRVE